MNFQNNSLNHRRINIDRSTGSSVMNNGKRYLLKNNVLLDISDECIHTYPCQHDCVLNGEKMRINGNDIYNIFNSNQIDIPEHFSYYEQKKKTTLELSETKRLVSKELAKKTLMLSSEKKVEISKNMNKMSPLIKVIRDMRLLT
jgi:hypothetical protein